MKKDAPVVMTLALLLLGAAAADLGSESVTLTTWYPAPSGVYVKIVTTADTYLARDAGKVGIGTSSPSAKLDVAGSVRIADGSQANGDVLTSDASGLASWKAFKTEVYTTSYVSVIGRSVTCAVAGHQVVSCVTYEAPSGASICGTSISGNKCWLGGCVAPAGETMVSQVVCAGF